MSPYYLRMMAISSVIILILSSMFGCTLFDGSDEEEKRQGFTHVELLETIPDTHSLDMPGFDPKPILDTWKKQPIGNIATSWFFKNTIFTDFGGAMKIFIQNNGTTDIFVYRIGIKPNWQVENLERYSLESGIYTDVGKYVNVTKKEYIGLLSFPGPSKSGEFEYSVTFSVYQQNETGSWNDCGVQEGRSMKLSVTDLTIPSEYKQHYNLPQYYDKINDIVNPTHEDVINKAHELASRYAGPFNIYQVCAIFDYVTNNINYVSDPSHTENYWCRPEQTLEYGGDCEDFSTLLASMIIAIGGSVRMYLTDSHAFIGLYIGDESDSRAIAEAIQNYYQTELFIFWLQDDFGSWLIIDGSGSFYIGDFPLGSTPVKKQYGNFNSDYTWTWDFSETKNLFIIDVKPK